MKLLSKLKISLILLTLPVAVAVSANLAPTNFQEIANTANKSSQARDKSHLVIKSSQTIEQKQKTLDDELALVKSKLQTQKKEQVNYSSFMQPSEFLIKAKETEQPEEVVEVKNEEKTNEESSNLDKPEEVNTALQKAEPAQAASVKLTQKLIIRGQVISYENGGLGSGQAIIDANSNMVSTWGGAQVNSVSDGQSSHLIGHNPGVFSILLGIGLGEGITVYDSNGDSRTYSVSRLVKVDDQANNVDDPKENFWSVVDGIGQGEQIALQTCINDDINLLVIAN